MDTVRFNTAMRLNLSSQRGWRLLAAMPLLLAVHAWAQAGTSRAASEVRPADATASFREGRLVESFGKWEIRKGLIDNTYLLIGESTGDGAGHFWLHCDQNNLITVAVPLGEQAERERLRSHSVLPPHFPVDSPRAPRLASQTTLISGFLPLPISGITTTCEDDSPHRRDSAAPSPLELFRGLRGHLH